MIDPFSEETRVAIDASRDFHRSSFFNSMFVRHETFPRFFAFSPTRIDEARLGIHRRSIRIPRRHGREHRRALYSGSVSSARWRSVPRENTRMFLYRARYYPWRNFAFPYTSLRVTHTHIDITRRRIWNQRACMNIDKGTRFYIPDIRQVYRVKCL